MSMSANASTFAWGVDHLQQRLQDTLTDPDYEVWWRELQNLANQALITPIPVLTFEAFREFADHGGREEYQQLYFEKRGRIGALAIVSLNTTDDVTCYIEALEEALWDICNEYTWCLPAHLPPSNEGTERAVWEEIDLFAAETAAMVAELYTLFEGRLDTRIMKRIELEVQRRIFKPMSDPEQLFTWETADHNWSAVCGSGCGIAALLLLKSDDPVRGQILERVIGAMDHFLSGYGEDGGCAEGLGYWVYGFGYYTYFVDMLVRYEPQHEWRLRSTKMMKMAAFPEHIHLSEGVFVNFSDSDEEEILPAGLLSRLGEWTGHHYSLPFQMNRLMDDPCRRWAHLIRNVLWADPRYFASNVVPTPFKNVSIYLPDLQWMICKNELPDSQITVALATKGGHNDEPHNHNDLGSFIIHAGGENILSDLGAGLYTQAYFAHGREQILNISSAGHSVPQIDGQEQQSGREAYASVVEPQIWKEEEKEYAVWKVDLTHAYDHQSLHQYTRSLDWQVPIGQEEVTIDCIDQFRFYKNNNLDENHSVSYENSLDTSSFSNQNYTTAPSIMERLISKIKPIVEADQVRWQGRKAEVCLNLLHAQDKVNVEVIEHVDHEGQALVLYRTSIQYLSSIEQSTSRPDIAQSELVSEDVKPQQSEWLDVVVELPFVIRPL